MAKGEAASSRIAIQFFLGEAQEQIVSQWRAAVERMAATDEPTESLVEFAPDLLQQIGGLAEAAHAESLDRTFEIARSNAPRPIGEACSVSHLLAELSALRQWIVSAWKGSAASRSDDAELGALHTAIDALMSAVVSRCDEASRSGFGATRGGARTRPQQARIAPLGVSGRRGIPRSRSSLRPNQRLPGAAQAASGTWRGERLCHPSRQRSSATIGSASWPTCGSSGAKRCDSS